MPFGRLKAPPPVKGDWQLLITSPDTVQAVIDCPSLLATYMVVPVESVKSARPRGVLKDPPVKGVAQVVREDPEMVQAVTELALVAPFAM